MSHLSHFELDLGSSVRRLARTYLMALQSHYLICDKIFL